MYGLKRRWLAAGVGTVAALAALGTVMAQEGPPPPGVPLATGLDHPRGLAAVDDGAVLVAEGAAGNILRIDADGTVTEVVTGLPTATVEVAPGEVEITGPSSVVPDGSGGYFIAVGESTEPGLAAVYTATAAGVTTLLADLGDFEEANNTDDDVDLEGQPELLSNPYDLVADGSGGVYVNDSGANTTLHVDAQGNITVFAVYLNRENPLFPNVGGPTMDQVPTGITIGPDGAVYVSTLTGFPFPQGAARVYRLEDANNDGDALDDGEVTVYAEGLSSATDLVFDEDGSLLVSQFSTNMLVEAPGRITRVVDGVPATHLDGLITPTAITVTSDGRIVVAQEFAGLVSDVTDVMPGPGFTDQVVPGVNLIAYSGGTLAQLIAEASAAGATSVSTTVGGEFVVHVVGAPAFVNAEFAAAFAAGIPAGTPILVVQIQ